MPCCPFIFFGVPYVERLRSNHNLTAAVTGIIAAVVGVIANLTVFFPLPNLFARSQTLTAGPVHLEIPS